MPNRVPRICIDLSTLDHLSVNQGQFRYAIDLLTAFERLRAPYQFWILGSKTEPVEALRRFVGESADAPFVYRGLPPLSTFLRERLSGCPESAFAFWNRIDLWHGIHTHLPPWSPCPVLVTEHDLMFDVFDEYAEARRSKHYRRYRDRLSRLNAHVLCISETTRRDLLHYYPMDPSKISVVTHGSDFYRVEESAAAPASLQSLLQSAPPWLASPYNLEPRKNLSGLLKAFAILRQDWPQAKLVLFGRAAWSAAREAQFEEQLRELALSEHVLRTGFVDDGELRWIYRHCTGFVFPTLYEGFGLPLLEAMQCGACVIARGESAMAEVVGQAGVLVETQDAPRLAQACAAIFADSSLRDKCQRAAQERALPQNTEWMARNTIAVYQRLLEKAR